MVARELIHDECGCLVVLQEIQKTDVHILIVASVAHLIFVAIILLPLGCRRNTFGTR